ncbi:hypothetical protein KUTeg_002054 [Tegillarca granosa]|uniref:Peptidase M28 domain-containing protein n=1 Tax=Tegillarca granosa TaxID=220873 RepID=A0ABQ9FT85_TEGGR|nr:hypothetical protein KUTeg_002054 [Tegillarca granosa]
MISMVLFFFHLSGFICYQVKHAEGRGAAGVILYSDPADFANNQSYVYPQTWWLPGWAVHSSHVRYTLVGDPQTPGYAAIEMFGTRKPCVSSTSSQTIEMVITAKSFISQPRLAILLKSQINDIFQSKNLDGQIAPNDWFGGLNITYKTGPGHLDGSIVELSVKNIKERRNISNTIAVINGKYEKDRYIIIGAHVDSWTQGAVDAGTGYAVLWELARTFNQSQTQCQIFQNTSHGWRPRRTLIFALWDGNSYGHIGSYEWVQEFEKELGPGNYSFSAEASPMLHDIIKSAAKTVTCTDPDYHDESVYDMWTKKFPSSDDPTQPNIFLLSSYRIHPPRGDSDHSPFIFHLGIPLYSNMSTYPAFSTLEDTYKYVNVYIDPKLKLHMAVTQITSDVILRLADSALLPIDICDFSKIFNEGKKYLSQYQSVFKAANINLFSDNLNFWTQEFIIAAKNFHDKYQELYKDGISEEEACEYNDKIMKVLQTFVISKGLPDNPQYRKDLGTFVIPNESPDNPQCRNLLVAPHPENINTQQVYPGIAATLDEGLHNQNWSPLKEQVSYIIMALRQAYIETLFDGFMFWMICVYFDEDCPVSVRDDTRMTTGDVVYMVVFTNSGGVTDI